MKTCFLFGHSTAPYSIKDKIEAAAEYHYLNYNVRTFIVGSRGNFDSAAASAIKALKKKYEGITLLLLLAYHPAEHPVFLSDGFDNSYYPLTEKIPHRYKIVKTNQYMVDNTDTIICYVAHGGNTRNLLEYAERRQKKEDVIIENLGQNY